jgi:hypothetical protein
VLARYQLRSRPLSLSLNCDSTCAAVVDADHVASLLDLGWGGGAPPAAAAAAPTPALASSGGRSEEEEGGVPATGRGGGSGAAAVEPVDEGAPALSGQQSEESWPDVWAVVWADDAPDAWAACARGQLLTFRGVTAEAPQPR